MQQTTLTPPDGPSTPHTLPSVFPPPALSPRVSAVATGAFKLGRVRVAEVDVYAHGFVVSVLVRLATGREPARVVPPMLRGGDGISFTDRALEIAVQKAAVEAAQHAEARGWLG